MTVVLVVDSIMLLPLVGVAAATAAIGLVDDGLSVDSFVNGQHFAAAAAWERRGVR